MALPSDFDFDQLDMADPETRSYLSQNIDLSDPETKAWFDSTVPQSQKVVTSDVPLAEAGTPVTQEQSVFSRRLEEAQGVRPGLDPENEFGGPRVFDNGISNPLSTVRDIADLVARGGEYAAAATNTGLEYLDEGTRALGLDEALSVDGNKFLPGTAIGALMEAFPAAGAEAGLIPVPGATAAHNRTLAKGLSQEAAGFRESLFSTGTFEDIMSKAPDKDSLDPVAVKAFVDERDAGAPIDTTTTYVNPIDDGSIGPVSNSDRIPENTPVDPALEAEAAAFKASREPEVSDLWPTDESRAADAAAMEARLQAEAEAFQAAKAAPEELPTAETLIPEVDRVTPARAEVERVTEGWKNSPKINVIKNADEIADPEVRASYQNEGVNAKAFVDKNGEVHIIADNIEGPHEVPAIVFHEALGHNGMTQKFGKGLDGVLTDMYNTSEDFRSRVNQWMEEMPDAYSDRSDRLARAADEVLAEMSESGQIDVKLLDKIKNYVKSTARRAGLTVDYSMREIEAILGMAHDAVINGKTPRENGFAGNRFMRTPEQQNIVEQAVKETSDLFPVRDVDKAMTEKDFRNQVKVTLEEGGTSSSILDDEPLTGSRFMRSDRKKSLSPDSMRTVNDVDDLIDLVTESTQHLKDPSRTIDEIKRGAEDIGLTVGKYTKGKQMTEGLSDKIAAAHQLVTNLLDEVAAIGERARTEGMTPSNYMTIKQKLASAEAVYARFDNDTAEVGRALRVLREVSESRKSAKSAMRFMQEAEGADGVLANPASLEKFVESLRTIKETEGPDAAARYFSNARKAKAEDYLGSVVFNFMLSSPTTWSLNAVGSPLSFGMDLISDAIASIGGQALRGSQADRVYGRAIAGRIYGGVAALKNYKTFKNTFDSFMDGEGHLSRIENKTGQSRMVLSEAAGKLPGTAGKVAKGVVGGTVEVPARIMSATDEFWRNIFDASNLYGEVLTNVIKEGYKGKDVWDETARRISNPNEAILERAAARKVTERQLFRDQVSSVGQKILDAQKPRFEDRTTIQMIEGDDGKKIPVSKVEQKKSSALGRVGKFGFKAMVPFVGTIDSILRTAGRNSGVLRAVSPGFWAEFKAGGATRQSALARMAISQSVLSYWFIKAMNGDITGVAPEDPKKAQAQASYHPPMSIKVGDNEWMSYKGLDPVATQMAAVATMAERMKQGEQPTADQVAGLVFGLAHSLSKAGYAESISNMVDVTKETLEAAGKGEFGPATANFVGGYANNLVNPGFVRWINQEFLDPYSRDTTGDRTFAGRVAGRAMSGTPWAGSDQPQKYDVFGREVLNPRQTMKQDNDPVVIEVARLEKGMGDKILMTAPQRKFTREGQEIELNGEQYSELQRISGYYFTEGLRQIVGTEEWENYDDDTKRAYIKELLTDARDAAKEQLFPSEEETNEDEEGYLNGN